MIHKKVDKKERFISIFNSKNGHYIRTGILDENGKDTNIDPFMSSYPELIDIGIMGNCKHGQTKLCLKSGVQCYQNGLSINKPNITVENFKKIISESKGKVFQVALGGRGDPDCHENFEDILRICKENNIVPNYTTSGFMFNEKKAKLTKEFCGAAAVSFYKNKYTYNTIDLLLEHKVKTNIHYVLGNNSIEEAIYNLENDIFPKGINAIIFLLHKPVGIGEKKNVLDVENERVKYFFNLIDTTKFDFKIGFDSCTIPGLINFSKNINPMSFDTCEGARFSMYISADMKAMPCSFDQDIKNWHYDILNDSIENAWKSQQFDNFRNHMKNSCSGCLDRLECMGGCPIVNNIVLCNREERNKK